MATATPLPDPVIVLARRIAALLEETKELAKSRDVTPIWEALAGHLRSAAPLVLLAAPPPSGVDDALIDLGDGAVIRLRVIDGLLSMYVCERSAHDVNVTLTEQARAELIAALGVVR